MSPAAATRSTIVVCRCPRHRRNGRSCSAGRRIRGSTFRSMRAAAQPLRWRQHARLLCCRPHTRARCAAVVHASPNRGFAAADGAAGRAAPGRSGHRRTGAGRGGRQRLRGRDSAFGHQRINDRGRDLARSVVGLLARVAGLDPGRDLSRVRLVLSDPAPVAAPGRPAARRRHRGRGDQRVRLAPGHVHRRDGHRADPGRRRRCRHRLGIPSTADRIRTAPPVDPATPTDPCRTRRRRTPGRGPG